MPADRQRWMAASMSVTPICQVSTLGGSFVSRGLLDAEMLRFGSCSR